MKRKYKYILLRDFVYANWNLFSRMRTESSQVKWESLKKNYYSQNSHFLRIHFECVRACVCSFIQSSWNYVHLLTNISLRTQNQTMNNQKHRTPGFYFVIRGKKEHAGILEYLVPFFCSQIHYTIKQNPSFHIHFVQTWPLQTMVQSNY